MQRRYYVYIMASERRTIYTGMTNDIRRRVGEHKQKQIPGFTQRYNVTRLVYVETRATAREAIRREKQIKGWRRSKKLALVASLNPRWRDLSASSFEE